MKRALLLVILFFVTNSILFSQNRFLTSSATPGELYLSSTWYIIYDPYVGPPYLDSVYKAVFHITENGKKITIPYNVEIIRNTIPMGSYMEPFYILSDATPGVVYMQCHYTKNNYPHTSLWISFDYGKNWMHRREIIGSYGYFGTCAVEGTIYTSDMNRNILRSKVYGNSFEFDFFLPLPYSTGITAYQECEFFGLGGGSSSFYNINYTNDCAESFTVIPIGEEFIYGSVSGISPNVYRGGLPGEVYVSSWFPGYQYKVSFSADTGHTFRHVYVSEEIHLYNVGSIRFMSDREPGVFYIVTTSGVIDYEPLGEYLKVCIAYYRDYGETLVGTYCHDLHKNYGKTCEAVNDLISEKCGNSCVLLTWSEPESSLPVVEYWVYRKGEGKKEKDNSPPMYWRGGREADGVVKNTEYELVGVTKGTTFLDENLLVGEYEYYVVAHYEMGCVADSSNHVKIEIEVGIDEYLQPNFTIIPNPATNQVTISSATSFHSVEIINFLGQTVVSQSIEGNTATVNVSNLNNGVYFVRVFFEGGGSVKKLVKQ